MTHRNINLGIANVEIKEHNNGAVSISGPNSDGQTQSFSYEAQSDDSHLTEIETHLDNMLSNANDLNKQKGMDFLNNVVGSSSS